jgi:nucleotide-binding universal stress UspA family protein
MEKHLLVTVSEQKSALKGVRFVGSLFKTTDELKLTLFYTAPRPPRVWEGERTLDTESEMERQATAYEAKGRKALETAKKELIRSGLQQERINTKLQVRRFSKVADIIQEGERGLYDAVVLGRRGLSWIEEAFDESASKGILEKKVSFPLWLCRGFDPSARDILLCVDGSDASYRMADHVGFILNKQQDHRVILFMVKKAGEQEKDRPDAIFSIAGEHLLKNGFPVENVETRVVQASNAAKAILKESARGEFAAVAMGRTGKEEGILKSLFTGSVSDALFRGLDKAALWICH